MSLFPVLYRDRGNEDGGFVLLCSTLLIRKPGYDAVFELGEMEFTRILQNCSMFW